MERITILLPIALIQRVTIPHTLELWVHDPHGCQLKLDMHHVFCGDCS